MKKIFASLLLAIGVAGAAFGADVANDVIVQQVKPGGTGNTQRNLHATAGGFMGFNNSNVAVGFTGISFDDDNDVLNVATSIAAPNMVLNGAPLSGLFDAKQNLLNNSAGLMAALSDFTGTGVVPFNIDPTFVGLRLSGSLKTTYIAMPANDVNFGVAGQTKSLTSNVTFTYSASPVSRSSTWVELTADGTDRTVTLPSTYSFQRKNNITSVIVPANTTMLLNIMWTGARYQVLGDPAAVTGTGTLYVTNTDPTFFDTSTTTPRGVQFDQYNNGTNSSQINLRKARGTPTAPTTVASGDLLSRIISHGYDGTGFVESADIRVATTGTIGTNRVPTTITFRTNTDAAPSVLTDALTLGADQKATFGGEVITPPSSTAGAGFNLTPGIAPTSPVNGDLWATSTGFFGRINGVTVGPFGTGGTASFPLSYTPTGTAANTPVTAITLGNGDAATSGSQRYSGYIFQQGNAFETSGNSSQPVTARYGVVPVQGSSATGNWVLDFDINGGGYNNRLSVSSVSTGTSSISGSWQVGLSSFIVFGTNRSKITSAADGRILFSNNAINGMTRVGFGIDNSASWPALGITGTTPGLTVVAGDGTTAAFLTVTGALTPSQTAGIVGTTTTNNANAGSVGEYVSSAIASGSAVSLTTATTANVTSISLTAGDWDVEGNVNWSFSTATTTSSSMGISTTTATLPTDGTEVANGTRLTTTSGIIGSTAPRKRISISSTTTVYLVAQATFSPGSASAYGAITARRVR